MVSAGEITAMRRAIAISAHGVGSTSPNPPVGCVILDSAGIPIGEGYHVRKGDSHAEVHALRAAGGRAVGGTAVVTLEPCNHTGRTPPCREALLQAGVARVVIAVMDPTSRGEGGAAVLRQSGVDVETGVLREEALLVLSPWLTATLAGRPFLTWAYAADPDGSPVGHPDDGPVSAALRQLRGAHDLVVNPSGVMAEGRPQSHGGGDVFHVPAGQASSDTHAAMDAFRSSGARSVLLEGVSGTALSFAADALLDQVVAFLQTSPPSHALRMPGTRLAPFPEGFRLTDVAHHGDHVRLTGRRI
ncbi:MAG: bifunctional diaminohydroxyphosphoribosylaminopyrimidine deaminase/5-amino-6-(5-phosphoribosylamino)uracil reductase RibD [Streptomyces sp.]|nr:bifunctional diaminohydroxyphosphoribosylaminopyrimidine deaminase/5-amino-6-(5-phosphoribosylamino)uracil reductase RibD [Streptomyces sp.]